MPLMSKVDLFAAIRRDSRAGMSVRAMAGKYQGVAAAGVAVPAAITGAAVRPMALGSPSHEKW
jgi:hypothetical protein